MKPILTIALAMLCLTALAVITVPGVLADPLCGLTKNVGLLACAAVVWALLSYERARERLFARMREGFDFGLRDRRPSWSRDELHAR